MPKPRTNARERFVFMSVPGRLEDGSDTGWFVFNWKTRESITIGDGDAMRPLAIARAKLANAASSRSFLFVGERRSATAIARGWSWSDGRLAAKPLFEALHAMGVRPTEHAFANLFDDTHGGIMRATIVAVVAARARGVIVVALGQKVSHQLARRGLVHVALVHPAARGAIRKRERYIAHVHEQIGAAL